MRNVAIVEHNPGDVHDDDQSAEVIAVSERRMSDERMSETATDRGRLGWLLLEKRDALVERWAQRILLDPEVPSANRLSRPALEDHIPTLVTRLLQRLALHAPNDWGERAGRDTGANELGLAHAQQRSAAHFTIGEALRELSHFREAILELCTENEIVLKLEEAKLLHTTIDELMAASVTERERMAREESAQVMAMVAHDLRAPLSIFAMHAALMKDGAPLDVPSQSALLDRNVAQMKRLIEDLLTATKLEAGHMSIELAPVDARTIIDGVVAQLAYAASRKRIRVTSMLPDQAVVVPCDPDRIEQVLGNLLGNALKFTPVDGAVKVQLVTSPTHAIFRVIDDGPGIPSEHHEAIFQPFWQGPATARSGIGLGLAIARGIVEAHGGTIAVEAPTDGGSVFCFTIPLEAIAE
jgi:signal transduction histidine kinase